MRPQLSKSTWQFLITVFAVNLIGYACAGVWWRAALYIAVELKLTTGAPLAAAYIAMFLYFIQSLLVANTIHTTLQHITKE